VNLWLEVPGGDDEKIADDQVVELQPGMHFFTAPATITPGRMLAPSDEAYLRAKASKYE